MADTGCTSTAVPVRNTSVARFNSSGQISRSTTLIPRLRARSMTVSRVMPLRMVSVVGVCNSPSMRRNRFAPVASDSRPL